ncbi:MAG: hypothetical protein ACOC33_01235 [bacterium]
MITKYENIKRVILKNFKDNKIKYSKVTFDYNGSLNDYVINIYTKIHKLKKDVLYELEETIKEFYGVNMEIYFYDKIVIPNKNKEYYIGKDKYNKQLECFTIYLSK